MPRISTTIEIVTLCHAISGEIITEFLSACAPGYGGALELWRGRKTGRFFLYSLDAYRDEKLLSRRQTENMMAPSKPRERLTLIGHVYHASNYRSGVYVELSRAKLRLKRVPIDEV